MVKAIPMPVLERRPPQHESFRAYTAHAANPAPAVYKSGQVRSGQARPGQVKWFRYMYLYMLSFTSMLNDTKIRGGHACCL